MGGWIFGFCFNFAKPLIDNMQKVKIYKLKVEIVMLKEKGIR